MPRLTEDDIEDLIGDTRQLDKILTAAKIRKDVGTGDQAEIDALRSKIELEKTLGNLFTRDQMLEAIVQEHLSWGQSVDSFPALVLDQMKNTNLPMEVRELVKTACEDATREIRRRMSVGRKDIVTRAEAAAETAKEKKRGRKGKMG